VTGQTEKASSQQTLFPIVGIGASAGGLDAFKRFFTSMPADSGMAFVLVQHLDPNHESLTADLLARHTSMRVVEARDQMPVEMNHVYMIPPNKYLTIRESVLQLSEPVLRRGLRMPIDNFFRSLAEAHEERAFGIILSGTGSDGTLGVKAIKGAGGVTLAQIPESAQYDGMPRSAIATGLVDFVVRIEGMPEILIRYAKHAVVGKNGDSTLLNQGEPDILRSILAILRTRTKYDFNCYKEGTLMRRIGRRMGLNHLEILGDYLNYMREHPDEAMQLFRDLLIGVTGFFREPEAFNTLEEIIAKLVQEKAPDTPIRVWVPGCATGEEAYSIAMLVAEQLRIAQKKCPVQIFATDIDEEALSIARAGIYPENIAADISPDRLQVFFEKEGDTYQVRGHVRDSIVFAVQNLIADPPFSKLDLVSCRNLLIYLKPDVQKKIIELFHFALNEVGYLFLGSAESIGQHEDLFNTIVKKSRLYQRIGAVRRNVVEFPIFPTRHIEKQPGCKEPPSFDDPVHLGEFVRGLLLDHYAPASVLVNRKFQITYYFGPIERYLKQPAGTPTDDLMVRARDGLGVKLRTVIQNAFEVGSDSPTGVTQILDEGVTRRIRITVNPVMSPKGVPSLLLVSFVDERERAPSADVSVGEAPSSTDDSSSIVQQLESELQATREDLQSTVEEMESSNEELKAANEEVMSVNEELQSTNEELETSKEELQSLNEELITVNSQLEEKVSELVETTDVLNNLLSSTGIATLFLDAELRIKRFTPATDRLFNLIPTDIGRPISDISRKFHDPDLLTDAKTVLDRLAPIETEVFTEEAKRICYVRCILPFRTNDNRIDGVVITFVDITERKEKEILVQRARSFAEAIVNTIHEPLLILDKRLRVISANRSFYNTFRTDAKTTEGLSVFDIANGQWNIPTLRTLLEEIIPEQGQFNDYEVTHDFQSIGHKTMLLNARKLEGLPDQPRLTLLAIEDISKRKDAERAFIEEKNKSEEANQAKSRFLSAASHDLRQPLQALSLLNRVLENTVMDPGTLAIIEKQTESISSMGELLNSFLNLSKIQAGAIEPVIRELSIAGLLERLKREFALQTQEKGLGLHVVACSATIRSDPNLLDRILHNFIANAIAYTNTGKVLIGCRRQGSNLRIEVWDTGAGIPANRLETVFVEFHQLDNPAREKSKGMGLGLAVAKYTALLLGHPIDVRSTPGKGSMFAVEVPMQENGSPVQTGLTDSETVTFTAPPGTTVLLIEDDAAVLDATSLLLESLGFQVVTATTGVEALALLANGAMQPHCVISDYRLPEGLTGTELIQRIRALLKQDIPAAVLTGDISPEAIQSLQESGCKVLYKPVRTDELFLAVKQMIGKQDQSETGLEKQTSG